MSEENISGVPPSDGSISKALGAAPGDTLSAAIVTGTTVIVTHRYTLQYLIAVIKKPDPKPAADK